MGRLIVLPNDEELLLTELSSKSEKILGPKNKFPKFGFWTVNFFCVKKVTNIQKVTHPYLVPLSKKVLEVLHDDIANLARYRKWIFPIFDPKID